MVIPGLFHLIPNAVLCYFMYDYANSNPDVENTGYYCYAHEGSWIGYTGGAIPGSVAVTSEFLTWFKFGFILNVLYILIGLLMLLGTWKPLSFLGLCGIVLDCPVTCGWFMWFITGMVFRWRHAGLVCSGEYYDINDHTLTNTYLYQSGKFIQVYLIIVLSLFGALCLSGCIGGFVYKKYFGKDKAMRRN